MIDRKQCTVLCPMDNIKVSHEDPKVITAVLEPLKERYSKEAMLMVAQGKKDNYLGMTVGYSEDHGKVRILHCTMRWDLEAPPVRHPTYTVCVYAAHWLFCSTLRPIHPFFVTRPPCASFGPSFFPSVLFLSK
jgi:hypothetical protein